MEYIETLCDNCGHLLYSPIDITNHNCGGKLIPLELEHDDYITLCRVWSTGNEVDYTVHWDLYNAMVELKKNDIIEYNLKMTQFRTQVSQQKQQQESIKPHCPTCNSSNIKLISTTSKVVNTAMFGIFGTKRHKTFHCSNCGYEW